MDPYKIQQGLKAALEIVLKGLRFFCLSSVTSEATEAKLRKTVSWTSLRWPELRNECKFVISCARLRTNSKEMVNHNFFLAADIMRTPRLT